MGGENHSIKITASHSEGSTCKSPQGQGKTVPGSTNGYHCWIEQRQASSDILRGELGRGSRLKNWNSVLREFLGLT